MGDREQASLPPAVIQGETAGFRSLRAPVGVGSPNDTVAVLLDVLVFKALATWQGDGHVPGRVVRRREGDCVVWVPGAKLRR